MIRFFAGVALLAAPGLLMGQSLDLSSLDKFKDKATDNVTVNLEGSVLQMAGKFLSSDDEDQAQVKKLVLGLKRIVVRSFTFDKPGAYLNSDVNAIRDQLREPEWKKIVEVHSKGESDNAEVYLRGNGDRISGLAVIAADAKELTVVNIDGSIDTQGLEGLSGNFGIPERLGKHREKGEKKAK
jgi:hypothetical protein